MAVVTLPTASKVNRIADAITDALQLIGAAQDGTKWLTNPKTVKRSLLLGDWNQAERPGLYVRVLSWRDSTIMGGGRRETRMTIGVTCVVSDSDGAEQALNDLARDVIRAISEDEKLKAAAGLVMLIYPVSYDLEIEAMNKSGLGLGTVQLEALFAWDKSAP